ncbi:RICIN domain-containing protein [Actinokineospora auranticolor]|uniref:Uncharacterized protein n=1 Tax=Actinokineospora auranticolor TaxID=155976 RepID=A0A2S6GBC9_9PSEU|nr:RICIN domain-containing protein [Actinokineospora auranticolor]PPK61206.1 hypothetical protein CLV40_1432 [Actinokineospora auranticolor]
MLRRPVLPRAEQVGTFLRACGEEPRLAAWMKTYERLAVGPLPVVPAEPESAPEPLPVEAPRGRAKRLFALGGVGCVLAAGAIYALSPGETEGGTGKPAGPVPTQPVLAVSQADFWVVIHPFSTPDLCVTAGHDRAQRYGSEVVVQDSCAAPGPRTLLKPAHGDLVHIEWEHPVEKVLGCLTVINVKDGRLLEPQDSCSANRREQLFRVERFAVESNDYRVRQADSGDCVAVDGTGNGAGITLRPCADQADQRFLVTPDGASTAPTS